MFNFIVLRSVFVILIFAFTTSAKAITNDSKLLAECEFIYSYTAQLLQLQNNTGAAVNILRRSSMMSTANLISNAQNGVVAASLIKSWTELRPYLKNQFDSQQMNPVAEATKCDKAVVPIAIKIRDSKKMLWGKDFDDLHKTLFQELRTSLGL
jgi:hypothetical protein